MSTSQSTSPTASENCTFVNNLVTDVAFTAEFANDSCSGNMDCSNVSCLCMVILNEQIAANQILACGGGDFCLTINPTTVFNAVQTAIGFNLLCVPGGLQAVGMTSISPVRGISCASLPDNTCTPLNLTMLPDF